VPANSSVSAPAGMAASHIVWAAPSMTPGAVSTAPAMGICREKLGCGAAHWPPEAAHTSCHRPLSAFVSLAVSANMSPVPGWTASAAL